MPIYAYKCESCGFAKDVLQKMSDTPLSVCPSCGKETFTKQLTAAGFQLKGSGWYVTDFKGNGSGSGTAAAPGDAKSGDAKSGDGGSGGDTAPKTESSGGSPAAGKSESKSESKPAESSGAKKPDSTPTA